MSAAVLLAFCLAACARTEKDASVLVMIEEGDGVTVTGYRGQAAELVIPAELAGLPVRKIAAGAFENCAADAVILPPGLEEIEDGAFQGSSMTELTLFDDLAVFSDAWMGDLTAQMVQDGLWDAAP